MIVLPASPRDVESRVEIRLITDSGHPACGQRGLFAVRDLEPGELVVGYLGYVHGGTEVERGERERRSRASRGDGGGDGKVDVVVSSEPATSSELKLQTPSPSALTSTSTTLQTPDTTPPDSTTTTPTTTDLLGSWDTSSYDLNMFRSEDVEIAVDASTMGNEARFVNDYRGVPAQRYEQGGLGEAERRREKRRVKGWDGEGGGGWTGGYGNVSGNGNGFEDGEGMGAQSGGSAGNVTGTEQLEAENRSNCFTFDIAMPNAEFRDIWFDISNDIDLTFNPKPTSTTLSSPNPNTDPITTSPAKDLTTTLKEVHLTSTPPNNHNPSKPRRPRKTGLRGVAVFVMPAGKAGKRKGGIKKGQEVLVSYGKGFWAHHGGEGGEGS